MAETQFTSIPERARGDEAKARAYKVTASVGVLMAVTGAVLVAFGVNMETNAATVTGLSLLAVGGVAVLIGVVSRIAGSGKRGGRG